ncbi:MAG: hypothetical protein EOP04_01945 [Proteobacteria bacterium]|nr:MAG: hypothetical protein EOP04_01945 [Pseudomonadota bacterium]
MQMFEVILVLSLALASCSKSSGGGGGGGGAVTPPTTTQPKVSKIDDNSSSVTISSRSTTSQTVSSSVGDTATSLTINPGSLSSDVTLMMEAGIDLVNSFALTELPLPSGVSVISGGSGVIIRPTASANLLKPIEISLKLPAASGLYAGQQSFVVFSRYFDPETKILMTKLDIVGDENAKIQTNDTLGYDVVKLSGYFGIYWVVALNRPLLASEVPAAVAATVPVVNKDGNKVIEINKLMDYSEIASAKSSGEMTLSSPSITVLDSRDLKVRRSQNSKIKSCKVEVLLDKAGEIGELFEMGAKVEVTAPISTVEAGKIKAMLHCLTIANKQIDSSWSTTTLEAYNFVRVYSVSDIQPKAYLVNDLIKFNLSFSGIVNVQGVPELALDLGANQAFAKYVSGSGTKDLIFHYTVKDGDDGSSIKSKGSLPLVIPEGAFIRDAFGKAVSMSTPVTLASSSVDALKPTLPSSVGFTTATTNLASIPFSWVASSDRSFRHYKAKLCEENDCISECTLPITTSTVNASASRGAASVYYACVQGIDWSGNESAWASSLSPILIDSVSPYVLSVTSPNEDRYYRPEEIINFAVTFSEPVFVGTSLGLQLNLNKSASYLQTASYVSGTGTSTILFAYRVQNYDNSAGKLIVTSMTGGSIADAAGNGRTGTFPNGTSPNSLYSRSIYIDTQGPAAPSITNAITTNNPISVVTGVSEPGATVKIMRNYIPIGTGVASSTGAYSATITSPLLNGSHSLIAEATDLAGNPGAQSNPRTITVTIAGPTVNAGSDVSTNVAVTLVGTATNATSLAWTKLSGPGTVTFGSPSSAVTTVSASATGEYELQLAATNSANQTTYDTMILKWDSSPPQFRGISQIWRKSPTETMIFWGPGADYYTPANQISYDVCVSSTPGSCATNFVVRDTVPPNTFEYLATGLSAGLRYEFMVRARDTQNLSNTANRMLSNGTLTAVSKLSIGDWNACAIAGSSKEVYCWGRAYESYTDYWDNIIYKQNEFKMRKIPGITNATSVAVTSHASCAALYDGTVKCWGQTYSNTMGSANNNIEYELYPILVGGVSNVTSLVAGQTFVCALQSDQIVKCWGHNTLGRGEVQSSYNAEPVANLSGVAKIFAGSWKACGLLTDGSIKCWGGEGSGQFGSGLSGQTYLVPYKIPNLYGAKAIALGYQHSCIITSSDTVKCVGDNSKGQLGNGSNVPKSTEFVDVTGLTGVTSISATDESTCAVSNGVVKCWGANENGELINGSYQKSAVPTSAIGVANTTTLIGQFLSMCAIGSDQTAKCWGYNWGGLRGSGVTAIMNSPVKVNGIEGNISTALGQSHSCALLSDRTVKCWGSNAFGQLGNGTNIDSMIPVSVPNLSAVDSISAGYNYTCAKLSDKTVKCWGANDLGQLGNGSNAQSSTPVAVSGLTGVLQLASGANHSCASTMVNSGNYLKCWGSNAYKQLASATLASSNVPLSYYHGASQNSSTPNILSIALGENHSCMITTFTNNNASCWGRNDYGQVGNGASANLSEPYIITGNYRSISLGSLSTCSVMNDSSLKCWGNTSLLSAGGTTYRVPTSVSSLSSVNSISLGVGHGCAVYNGTSLACWGHNYYGQNSAPGASSNGIYPIRNEGWGDPVKLNYFSDVSSVTAGYEHTCVNFSDSSTRCFGNNEFGQLGTPAPFGKISSNPERLIAP